MKEEICFVKNLSVSLKGKPVLSRIRMNLFRSEILGIIGLNGSGKTVLSDTLAGRNHLFEGDLRLHNEKPDITSERDGRDAGIYLINKDTRLIGNLTVLDNLILTWKSISRGGKDKKGYMRRLLDGADFLELSPGFSRPAGDLSPGEQFSMELLKALTLDMEIIILDSVFENCSLAERESLWRLIRKMQNRGCSFIITGYRIQNELTRYDRVGIMHSGSIVRFLDKKDFREDLIEHLVVGHGDIRRFARKEQSVGGPLLRLEELSSSRLSGFNLTLNRGEIIGICDIEEEGSRDLVRIFAGQSASYMGKIILEGRDIILHSIQDTVRNGIGIISDRFFSKCLFSNMSPLENLYFPILEKISGVLGFIPSKTEKYMERTYGGDFAGDRSAKEDLFRLQVVKWHLRKSRVLILDNPANNADIVAKEMIYRNIEEVHREGMSVLLFSTDLSEISLLCDRILLLKNGRTIRDMPINASNRREVEELAL